MLKKSLFLFTLFLCSELLPAGRLSPARAADEPAAFGLDERLGAEVPAQLTFYAEDGSPVSLGSLVNKPTILTLVYYECPSICGPLLNAIMGLMEEIQLEPGRDYQVVSISFNELEGPKMASQKKENFLAGMKKHIPPDSWRFLTGDKKNIDAISEATGFRFERVEMEYGLVFNHPATLIMLSPERIITGYLNGISFLPLDVTMALHEAKAGRPRETRAAVPRRGVLSFCYTFDPNQGKKVLNITRLAGTLTIALAGVFLTLLALLRWRPRKSETPHSKGA